MAINILIVDDSAVMRAMILKSLRMTGLDIGETFQAGNGQEGLEALNDNWIDVVIADINMPVMNGEEMIDHMRENPATADIPIVVISTEGSEAPFGLRVGLCVCHAVFQGDDGGLPVR